MSTKKKIILSMVTVALIGAFGYVVYMRMNTHTFNSWTEFQEKGPQEGVNNVHLDDEEFENLPDDVKDSLKQ
ncbi:hypothetical protein [Enterococcus caccae]|nr:hypothetical protein [Enterococcus caccae]